MLELDAVDFSYGPMQVLFGATMSVPAGERVAVLGTNGAGKSTLLKVAAGLLVPDGGAVRFAGDEITDVPAEERAVRGVTLVEGGRAVFPSVTVRENILVGAFSLPKRSPEIRPRFEEALELFPALTPRLEQPAGTLSGGEQQMVALARAVMARPRLLLVDELSLGLAPRVVSEVALALETMTQAGVTLVLVEQSLNVALALAENAYFMEKGEVRFSGRTTELLERGDLVRSVFFGSRAN
jgi:ABC-type branched-subunit amino acid transport system ATPase component